MRPSIPCTVAILLFTGCVSRFELEGTPCPCTDEYVCCAATKTCERACEVPIDAGHRDAGERDGGDDPRDAGERDAGAPDSGPTDLDAGFYDGGALPDAGDPPQSIGPWTWSIITGTTDRSADFTLTWTGREVLMVGGRQLGLCTIYHDRYNPWTDRWRRFDVDLVSRGGHVAAWTGSQLLLWGGDVCALTDDTFADGALWDPLTHVTAPIADAPGARSFAASAWMDGRLFVHGGECHADVCLERGAIYDPRDDRWIAIATEGAPTPFEGRRAAIWNGNQVLIWGGDEERSGRYFPIVDAWQPLPAPPFALGAGTSVWSGTELLVWDGAAGGRYDPRTNTWSPMSLEGAPTGVLAPQAVWTGREMIVIGEDGGGHYDPIADRWTPVSPTRAYYANANAKVVWTGREVLVIGSTVTGTHGARYGPRLSGDPACDGGAPPLEILIRRPTARTVVADEVELFGVIDTSVSVQRVSWFLDDEPVASTERTTIDLSATAYGPHTLRFEVAGATSTVCASRTLFVDDAPELDVTLPVAEEVATPLLDVAATCVDNGGACVLRVTVPFEPKGSFLGEDVLAVSTSGALSETIDLFSYEGRAIDLVFEVTDEFGLRTEDTRRVFVESSAALRPHALAESPVCDVSLTRVLFAESDRFVIEDVATGTTSELFVTLPPDCDSSRLVEPRDAILKAGSQVLDVVDGVVASSFASGGIRSAGDWIVSLNGTTLERRRPRVGLVEAIGTNPYPGEGYDIGADGDVVWVDRSGAVSFDSVSGTNASLTTLEAPPPFPAALASDQLVMWRRRTSTVAWTLEISNGVSVVSLTGPHEYGASGPRRDRDFAAAGAYVAYEAPDFLGVTQVWLRRPDGSIRNVSDSADPAQLIGLHDSGDLIFAVRGRLVHVRATTEQATDFGSSLGQVFSRHGAWFVRYGRRIFRLNL